MATFRTTSITAERRPTRRISLVSLSSLSSLASIGSSTSASDPPVLVVTTTVSTTTTTLPATVPPPFTTSRGSDDVLPRPRRGRGAPPVAPAAERNLHNHSSNGKGKGVVPTLRRAIGLKTPLNPALCEGWWCVFSPS
ncbi:hypothetical protein DFH08DRAFT_956834 [Mycena albidolilacea]|uniref:Uncharacterized protein n=1 Tax=Mycena albidolilacea TaxID=1033008 RepID=A0AAD7A876_9AGAR|nr:hypothetical protein DFH08DRAFT_956834 [Mycena albidolilacea]